jgi:hypothetical protein
MRPDCKGLRSAARFLAASLLVTGLLAASAHAQTAAPQAFPTPQKAVDTLVQAVRANDSAALQSIFGPDAEEILHSGDQAADKGDLNAFLASYKAKHQIVSGPDNTRILNVGAEDWPTPIPLRHGASGWYFDTAAGKEDLLYRRIGRNELDAIKVSKALVTAEHEYARTAHDNHLKGTYAAHFWSSPERHNGLYWEVQPGEPESPAGPLLAYASAQGYEPPASWSPAERKPFYGYFYKILTAQGPNAPGGSRNYFVNGALTGGFAILAYPAEYKSSGVMTFMVNSHGTVYEKDLGDDTGKLAPQISTFDTDKTWTIESTGTATKTTSEK